MKLDEAIKNILTLEDDRLVVFAKKPWTPDSEAIIDKLDENYCVPNFLQQDNFQYFLEFSIIKELSFIKKEIPISDKKFIEFVVFYAENDAYMDVD